MLGGRERLDEFADVRVLPFVDERHTHSMADECECGVVDDSGVHGRTPFDCQVEPE